MNIHDWALEVLMGTSLESKLRKPGDDLSDELAAPLSHPSLSPGRPDGLGFSKTKGRPFPGTSSLENERRRGEVFHFFANHELLALELMCLCLLRFPDAPPNFRRGLVRAVAEEQSHLGLYLERMATFGVQFGELPPNDFFWRCLKDMKSPLAFVTGMSLTFEQANLDFAAHFRDLFRQSGDHKSADVMERVYREEIGHVKFGFQWFDQWKDPSRSHWDSYRSSLVPPLTAQRAKGTNFLSDARLQAGIPAAFVEELRLFSHSKGRPPRVFWFDPPVESSWAWGQSWDPPQAARRLARDFDALPTFLAKSDDVVLVQIEPSQEWKREADEWGFDLPHYVRATLEDSRELSRELRSFKAASFEPWGWSHRSLKLFRPHCDSLVDGNGFKKLVGLDLANVMRKDFASQIASEVASQLNSAEAARLHSIAGCKEETVDGALSHLGSTRWREHEWIVFKAPLGSSGQSMKRHRRGVGVPETLRGWIANVISKQGGIVVEPWLRRKRDLSFQLEINQSGEVRVLDFTRMLTDHRGQYRGHLLNHRLYDFSDGEMRAFYGESGQTSHLDLLKLAANVAGERLAAKGYRGPVGIDALTYEDQQGKIQLRPVVEINARYTMGRVALALERVLHAKAVGLWLHTTRRQVEEGSKASLESWVEELKKKLPLLKVQSSGSGRHFIRQGILLANDLRKDTEFLALLVVAESEAVTALIQQMIPTDRLE